MNIILDALKRNTLLKIFAFIIAILMWFYVQIVQNPEISYDILEIPVKITGEAAINSDGFVIMSTPKNMKTNITVSTRRSKIKMIDTNLIQATLDVSGVKESGELSFPIRVKSDDYEVNVMTKNPSAMTLTIDKIITEQRPVKISYNGTLDSDYYIDKDSVVINPANATVKFPEMISEKVKEVVIDVDMTGITATVSQEFKGRLVDVKDEEINNTHAVVVSEKIKALIPVYKKKTLPVTLADTPEGVHFDISSVQIEVAGTNEVIDKLEYIEGYIDNYTDGIKTYTINLKLDNLIQIDKQEITATVVSIDPVS